MFRFGYALLVVGVAVAASFAVASADPASQWSRSNPSATTSGVTGYRVAVPTPASHFVHRGSAKTAAGAEISPWLYLNRCPGGCTVMGGSNDAMTNTTDIPSGTGPYTLGEFANAFGDVGSAGHCILCPDATRQSCSMAGSGNGTACTADTDCTTAFPGMNVFCDSADWDWNAFLTCMKEVDSPFALNVTDTVPPGGAAYTEGMIAGLPSQLGLGPDILGIAPILCTSPQDNAISFSFANYHVGYGQDRVYALCWTAAQETAHVWGLDHEYEYINGDSACNDPMTYRADCGGEKFYRNETAFVGTTGKGTVQVCRPTQNSYQMVLAVFGKGTSIVPNPTAAITFPAANASVAANFAVDANAGSRRGVADVELWLNGYKWASVGGAGFGQDGQPDPSVYTLVAPNGVPMGATRIVVKAFDDIGGEGDSAPVDVMFGAACTSDSACAKGQHCNTGAPTSTTPTGGCYWDAPMGTIGQTCTYPQFCMSGVCQGTSTKQICTEACTVGIDGQCPTGYDCTPTGGSSSDNGICFPPQGGGGCCSETNSDVAWVPAGLSALVLGMMFRRRRRAA